MSKILQKEIIETKSSSRQRGVYVLWVTGRVTFECILCTCVIVALEYYCFLAILNFEIGIGVRLNAFFFFFFLRPVVTHILGPSWGCPSVDFPSGATRVAIEPFS